MQNRNPYAAPQTNVMPGDGSAEEYGEIKIFSPHGRIGRVRYIGYSIGLSFLVLIIAGMTAAVVSWFDPTVALVVGGIGYVAVLVAQFLLTIQRSHDMNVTGWLSLIVFVPLAAFVFWFVPGTIGENRYGKRPPPNSTGVVLLACIVPFVSIVGILAAIAIPAYQDYTIRAQVSEGLSLAAAPRIAVADAFMRTKAAPADRLGAGLSAAATDTAGQYVASVDVDHGTILVTYASNANSMIADKVIALQPYVANDESVVWRCGEAMPPDGVFAMDDSAPTSAAATDIEPQLLPSACRP